MPRKKARGRFLIVLGMDGVNWKAESLKELDISPAKMVECLREYADFIERYFVKKK